MGAGEHDDMPDDADLERVMRAAGPRVQVPEEFMRSAREVVHAEWQRTVAMRRTRQRRRMALAAAASLAALSVALWIGGDLRVAPGAEFASIERTIGPVEYSRGYWPFWRQATPSQSLREGERLRTGPTGRVALALSDGSSLRLDQGTSVAFESSDRLVVHAGAVYVDSRPGEGGKEERLIVVTPLGNVTHLGTQYEVRLLDPAVRVRVREGRVELTLREGSVIRAEAGEQLTVSPGGLLDRATVARHGREWQWVGVAAPAFEIEGRRLGDFLTWVGRELGREVVYEGPESRTLAEQITLSGSISGLAPDEALRAVMSTTPLRAVEHGEQLRIEPAPERN